MASRIWLALGTVLGCHSDLECSLNGKCVGGGCICKRSWRGAACELLNFVPAKDVRSGIFHINISTWGAGVVADYDGAHATFHAYAAEFTSACGVSAWTHNSICAHYTASNPEGPFERRDVVESTFCHNPSITRTPDGDWLLYHIGLGAPINPTYTNCSGGATGGSPLSTDTNRLRGDPFGPDNYTSVLSSSSPNGPWAELQVRTVTATGAATGHLDNPAPLPPHSLAYLAHRNAELQPQPQPRTTTTPQLPLVMFAARNRYLGCPKEGGRML